MHYSNRVLCPVCAWRAECKKKFSMGVQTLHCPDYTWDVTLGDPDRIQHEAELARLRESEKRRNQNS